MPGRQKDFSIEDMRRIQVEQTDDAKHIIATSSEQGRMFALALSEEFGKLSDVDYVVVDAVRKDEHFPVSEEEAEHMLLKVRVNDEIFLLNASDLSQHHPSGWYSFRAAKTAQELVRLYKLKKGMR